MVSHRMTIVGVLSCWLGLNFLFVLFRGSVSFQAMEVVGLHRKIKQSISDHQRCAVDSTFPTDLMDARYDLIPHEPYDLLLLYPIAEHVDVLFHQKKKKERKGKISDQVLASTSQMRKPTLLLIECFKSFHIRLYASLRRTSESGSRRRGEEHAPVPSVRGDGHPECRVI